jgi:DUF1365 family protein
VVSLSDQASALYVGTIRHRRLDLDRQFTHRLALAYLDLSELPRLLEGRLLSPRPGPMRFRRRDYLRPLDQPLDRTVRERVVALGGPPTAGPIRLLTQPATFGLCFNPVSFYYLFDPSGERLTAVLAEVTNTPWGERHAYLLSDTSRDGRRSDGRFAKELHVSPFQGMDHTYQAHAGLPAETLSVHIDSRRAGRPVFDATLSLSRRPLTRAEVTRSALRFPLATARTVALIYGHALGLKLAGARVFPHPQAVA